jgi:hypothetical protein
MMVTIIVENEEDQVFVEAVLGSAGLRQPFEVKSGGGRSSAISLARSYLSLRDRSVALVVDSETTHPRQVREQQAFLKDWVAAVASTPSKVEIVVAVPEIEACLFSDPALAATVFGQSLPAETLIRGRFESKKTAMELLGTASPAGYLQAIKTILARPEVATALKDKGPFVELRRFVEGADTAEAESRARLMGKPA